MIAYPVSDVVIDPDQQAVARHAALAEDVNVEEDAGVLGLCHPGDGLTAHAEHAMQRVVISGGGLDPLTAASPVDRYTSLSSSPETRKNSARRPRK